MNFFSWIREGVRQAVLLGVADAVDNLGTTPDGGDYRERIGESLRMMPVAEQWKQLTASSGRLPRRKLGRSLEDIQAAAQNNQPHK